MKKALILHGTDGNSQSNWIGWLGQELTKHDYQVWVPDLPHAEKPNLTTYNQFLLGRKDWSFENNIMVGHSSGAVAILGLLQALPEGVQAETCYLVGSFKDDLGWEKLRELFVTPLNFELIKTKAKHFVFLHSDNDPHCPLTGAQYLHQQLGGELILLPDQFHFSVGTAGEKYRQFPYLLDLILS
ncbi:alpha/beta hydrolase [Patescibacteria group bacterium]|nr:alpha/beta hydrolase [Patescibacteria group bacterium]